MSRHLDRVLRIIATEYGRGPLGEPLFELRVEDQQRGCIFSMTAEVSAVKAGVAAALTDYAERLRSGKVEP